MDLVSFEAEHSNREKIVVKLPKKAPIIRFSIDITSFLLIISLN